MRALLLTMALAAGGAHAAMSGTASQTCHDSQGSGTTLECDLTSVGAGDAIHVGVAIRRAGNTNSSAATCPSGFSLVEEEQNTLSGRNNGMWCYKPATGGETTITVDIDDDYNSASMCVMVLPGTDVDWATVAASTENDDNINTVNTSQDTNEGTGPTPGTANAMGVAFASMHQYQDWNGSAAWSDGYISQMFEDEDVTSRAGCDFATKVISSAVAQDPTRSAAGDTGDKSYGANGVWNESAGGGGDPALTCPASIDYDGTGTCTTVVPLASAAEFFHFDSGDVIEGTAGTTTALTMNLHPDMFVPADMVMQFGDNSGNDEWRGWFDPAFDKHRVTIEIGVRYRVSMAVRRTAGAGTLHGGLQGFEDDGAGGYDYVNQTGLDDAGNHFHFVWDDLDPSDSEWIEERDVYFWNDGTSYSTTGGTFADPKNLHPDVEYVTCLYRFNRANQAGTYEAAYCEIVRDDTGEVVLRYEFEDTVATFNAETDTNYAPGTDLSKTAKTGNKLAYETLPGLLTGTNVDIAYPVKICSDRAGTDCSDDNDSVTISGPTCSPNGCTDGSGAAACDAGVDCPSDSAYEDAEFPASCSVENADNVFYLFPLFVDFTSGGTYEIRVGDVADGPLSSASARVIGVHLGSGTWVGGDAAGTLLLASQTGNFQAEDLTVGGNTNVATIAGDTKQGSGECGPEGGTCEWDVDGWLRWQVMNEDASPNPEWCPPYDIGTPGADGGGASDQEDPDLFNCTMVCNLVSVCTASCETNEISGQAKLLVNQNSTATFEQCWAQGESREVIGSPIQWGGVTVDQTGFYAAHMCQRDDAGNPLAPTSGEVEHTVLQLIRGQQCLESLGVISPGYEPTGTCSPIHLLR